MTYQDLVNQLTTLSGIDPAWSASYQSMSQDTPEEAMAHWDPGNYGGSSSITHQEVYAREMLRMLSGDSGMGAPAGTSWAEMFSSMNPITAKQLYGAKYDTMRPAISKGMGSLQSELLNNLSKVRTGGFESSGFADKQIAQARDIYGKKASDILVSEGQKRQDYMGSLVDQVMADRDLLSSWVDYGD